MYKFTSEIFICIYIYIYCNCTIKVCVNSHNAISILWHGWIFKYPMATLLVIILDNSQNAKR